MKYEIIELPIAEEDFLSHVKAGDKAILNKIISLVEELEVHPETGTGQVERLKHDKTGLWSRRINRVHRILYKIDEDSKTVTIYSYKNHY